MKIMRKKRIDQNGEKLMFRRASGITMKIRPGPGRAISSTVLPCVVATYPSTLNTTVPHRILVAASMHAIERTSLELKQNKKLLLDN